MLTEFDNFSLIAFTLALAVGAYFLAAATDNVIGADGFGTIPNMIILIAGAFLGLVGLEHLKVPIHNDALRMLACVAGAFLCLGLMSLLKAFAKRLHY